MALWRPFAAGERLTAGRLNALVGEWTPYTPIWSTDAGVTTLGNGTLIGKYQRIGNTINFRIQFDWGSGTSQTNPGENWRFSLPATPQSADGAALWPVSLWVIHSTGPNSMNLSNHRYTGAAYVDPTRNAVYAITYNAGNSFLDDQTFPSYKAETSGGNPDPVSVSPDEEPVVAGDRINIWGSYEAID